MWRSEAGTCENGSCQPVVVDESMPGMPVDRSQQQYILIRGYAQSSVGRKRGEGTVGITILSRLILTPGRRMRR